MSSPILQLWWPRYNEYISAIGEEEEEEGISFRVTIEHVRDVGIRGVERVFRTEEREGRIEMFPFLQTHGGRTMGMLCMTGLVQRIL